MKYTKTLLTKATYGEDVLFRGEMYEALNNEKTIEELVAVLLKSLKTLKGEVYVFKKEDEKILLLNSQDVEYSVENLIRESIVYKKLKETKRPYFDESGEIYAGFPLNYKGRLIGGLIVKNKQVIKAWAELYEGLNMLVFAFKYYDMIERERESNVKDSITGLYNERFFRNHLEVEEEKYKRKQVNHSLLLISVDNIQDISDHMGYEFEEKMLRKVAKIVRMQCRKSDMPAKIDRGLFAIILSHTVEEGAEVMKNRIINMLESEMEYRDKKVVMQYKSAVNEFQITHTKETFYNETLSKLK